MLFYLLYILNFHCTFFHQINNFLNGNSILEKFPSGFSANRGTETALTKIVGDQRLSPAASKLSVLVLLDLSTDH